MTFSHFARTKTFASLLAVAMLGGIGTYTLTERVLAQTAAAKEKASPASKEGLRHAQSLSEAFKSVAKAVGPSVVNIRSSQRFEQATSNEAPLSPSQPEASPDDPRTEDFFRRFFGGEVPEGFREFRSGPSNPQNPQSQSPRRRQRVGEGTGVIAREDGYIITNNHVVDGATEIKVKLDDEREYDATIIGLDPDTDLAVIKIEATGLIAAKLGNSSEMEVGEWVLAMGSPFGLQHTVTAGIVSAKGRANIGLTTFEDFIQTDAAINPGNSGGPLVNLYGEVIGINSAISTSTGTYSGVGLSIPSNIVKPVFESIVQHGRVEHGALGVTIQPLTEQEAEFYGFEGTQGVLIAEVHPDSAAAKAGIRIGDIVTKIDGKPTPERRVLLNTVADHRPGDKVNVEVFRKGEKRSFDVTLASRSIYQTAGRDNRGRPVPGTDSSRPTADTLGLGVQGLTPQLARQLNAETRTGVVVTRVTVDSLAAKNGINAGDLIMRVGETEVQSVEEFEKAIQAADVAKGIGLQVFRNGASQIIVLKNEEKPRENNKKN